MSYTLIGKFVDVKNKKRIIDAELGFLKNLNDTRYSNRFDDIHSSSKTKSEDYPQLTTEILVDYLYVVKAGLLNESWVKDKLSKFVPEYAVKAGDCYLVDESFYKENESKFKEFLVNLPLEEMTEGLDGRDDIISLYCKRIVPSNGIWYTKKDFEEALPIIKERYEKKKADVEVLKHLRTSPAYYEMSESAKNDYLEDVSYAEQDLEDYEWQYDSIVKIVNIFDFLQEEVGFPYTKENGQERYVWNYDDRRKIEVYIEVD